MATGEAAPVGDALVSEVEAPDFPPVRIPRRFVIDHSGREYVLADGLLYGLHELSRGHFDIDTKVEQLPNEANGMLAVASARITVFAGDDTGRILRAASGIGDASPQSVGRMMVPHLMRMAETRAKARALRDLLNVAAVSFEELGPGGGDDSPGRPVEAPQGASARPAASPDVAAPPPPPPPPAPPAPPSLQAELEAFGVHRTRAAALVADYPEAHIVARLAYVRDLLSRPGAAPVKNPGGYLAQAIEQGYALPESSETIFVDGRTFTRPQIEGVYQQRLDEAKRAGLGLGQVDLVPVAQTPLAQLVEKSRDLKRRLEARASAT